jgi:hemolysin activation/secretion protein
MHDLRLLALLHAGAILAAVAASPRPAAADIPGSPRIYDVEAYDVEGAKLLNVDEVETAVYPYLGPGRTVADIEKARAALQKAYSDRGYSSVVVDLPQQNIDDKAANIVRLHVVEATVGRLRVTGARYFSPDAIKREAAAFQEGQVPNINQAQAEVAELNRDPDRRVNPVLRAGVVPGTVDVDLNVHDSLPLHATLELNNDHNQYTTPLRILASVTYDNLFQLDHSASFTYGVAPENRANSEIFAGSYLAPVANTPVSLLVSGYDSNSNVATLGGTTVLGKGYSAGFRTIYQLPRLSGFIQSINLGMDFKRFDELIQVPTTTPTYAPVHYWPIVAAYNLQHDSEKASTTASLSITAGILDVGSSTAEFENARLNARPDFVHVNLDITHTETLWRGFTASQRVVGQLSDGPLVSSEEFAGGGFTSVRGYLQSEAVGDEGVTGQLELVTPTLSPKTTPALDSLRVYAFTDGGSIWILQPLADQTKYFALASAGLGLRLALLRHISGDVAVAVPFITGPATHAGRPRATFSLKSDF